MKPVKKLSAEEPQTDIYSLACPSRKALELVGSKWALLIFPALAAGPMRNSALLRKIEGISQKMLTQTLKELERNGLVTRCNLETAAPHVEYELSPLGESLSDTLIALPAKSTRSVCHVLAGTGASTYFNVLREPPSV